MDYNSTLEFLYSQIPAFHRVGSAAYKPGLERVLELSSFLGNPHLHFKCIHVAGTNGKGSTAHSLAAIFSAAGYRTGLFTSPHIVDFRERIRIDGSMIPEQEVVGFVERSRGFIETLKPSFFELTTVMAFDYFSRNNVDIAIVEVGLGGRLDSTNIITPEVSVITNISLDHTSLLGKSEVEIAGEKAGIIKAGVPVVIGEAEGQVKKCFIETASLRKSAISFADESGEILSAHESPDGMIYRTDDFGTFIGCLRGDFQIRNMATILEVVRIVNRTGHFTLGKEAVVTGLGNVVKLTGLMGRWMILSNNPFVVCDTGHNPGGWKYISRQLKRFTGKKHLVIGFVNDKDVRAILSMIKDIPQVALYFSAPSTPRALEVTELRHLAEDYGLDGLDFDSVEEAYKNALAKINDKSGEMIFVGGSNFVVADFVKFLLNEKR